MSKDTIPAGYVPVAEASKVLGMGTENLRRILRTGAMGDDAIGGNNSPWYVRADALNKMASNKRETFADMVGDDALRLSIMEIVAFYGCSIYTAVKIRRAACQAIGAPTPGERRDAQRKERGAVGTAKGYQKTKGVMPNE